MAASVVLELIVQLKDQATSGLQSLGQTAGGLGRFLGGAALAGLTAGTLALGGALGMAVSEASEAQQGMAQLEAVLQSTGGKAGVTKQQVLDLASSLSASNGLSKFSDDAVLAGENLLLTFTNIGKDVFPQAAQAAVDMAQALGGDPQSQAIALGKALNDPIAGVSALGRVGVSFTESQKAMIKSMVEAGNVAGAQKIILAELAGEFGGSAAKAAATFSGQLITLREKFNGILEGVGTAILPAIQQFVGLLTSPESLGAIQGFADALTAGVGVAMQWVSNTALPALQQAWVDLQPAMQTALSVGQQVVTWIGEQLPVALAFVNEHWDAFKAALIAVGAVLAGAAVAGTILSIVGLIASLANPITLIIGAIALLAAAWTEDWGGIRTQTMEFWQTTGKPIFEQLVAWLGVNIPIAVERVSTFWTETLWPALQKVWSFLDTYIIPIISALANVYFAALGKEIQILAAFWTETLWPALQKVASFVRENAGPALAYLNDNVLKPLGVTFDNITKGIGVVIDWLDKLASGINSIQIPDWLEGHSPPPMANWLNDIGAAAQNATAQLGGGSLPSFAPALAVATPAGGGGDVNVYLTVQGTVISERDFVQSVRDEFIKLQKRNTTTGIV